MALLLGVRIVVYVGWNCLVKLANDPFKTYANVDLAE